VFNRLVDERDGRRLENESIVNLPNWTYLTWRSTRRRPDDDGAWLDVRAAQVQDYVQELDLRRGVLSRRFRVTDDSGRRTAVAQRRLVSMADPYAAGLQSTFVAENWSGPLLVRAGIDGRVENRGVARYAGFDGRHLRQQGGGRTGADALALDVETVQSHVRVSTAVRQRVLANGTPRDVDRRVVDEDGLIADDLVLDLAEGVPHTVEKVTALYTSRDRGLSEPGVEARDKASCMPWFEPLLARHVLAWSHLWERCELEMNGPDEAALALRLHLFHVLQTVSEHSVDLDVGIPARGLHGEAYRGHIFWDEMFVFPYLNLRMPELSRALLLYRWRRLPQARRAAAAEGRAGAMFPWQSGSNGREEAQVVHLNPRSGRWLPDNSRLQRHIDVAVAWNTWHYLEATGDADFLAQHGAELLLEVARFWAAAASYDRSDDRYDIRGVMGPDEYHDAYPWREAPGLDNNAYTNVMVAWTLQRTLDAVEALPPRRRGELLDLLDVGPDDLERWDHLSRRLRLCWHEQGILSQFEGYERLEEFPWTDYIERYGDISRLDRILEAEGDTPNRYRVSKQADVLMLFFLLAPPELRELLERLGYPYDNALASRNVDYYRRRTSHGSTLSKIVHAWVLARTDRPRAWDFFLDAMRSDIADVQGGTTAEGIHLGAMAATVDLLQRGFTGLDTRGDVLHFDPCLPDGLASLRFRLRYRQHAGLQVALSHETLDIGGGRPGSASLRVRVQDQEYEVEPGGTRLVALRRATQ
jgi:trehalose/maltose hydrolase-like predicted phosphorylase